MDMIKLLDDAEKAIATLMLEVNRLNDEIILKDKKIEALKLRELSDEEILKVLTEDYHGLTIVNFARAILRKASEK